MESVGGEAGPTTTEEAMYIILSNGRPRRVLKRYEDVPLAAQKLLSPCSAQECLRDVGLTNFVGVYHVRPTHTLQQFEKYVGVAPDDDFNT